MKKKTFNGLPNIDKYLIRKGDGYPITTPELNDISEMISAKTLLTDIQSKQILNLFFQEIRGRMLRGEIINLKNFGKFFISSPLTSNNSRKIFPKFYPSKYLLNKLNRK